MQLAGLCWAFTSAVLLHNAEEAVWLPAWSASVPPWFRPVSAPAFRVAVAVFSSVVVVLTAVGSRAVAGGVAAYTIAGYVLAMGLNALVPHALLTVVTKRYAPGTATGVLLVLPLALEYLRRALWGGNVAMATFVWAGPLVAVGVLLLAAVSRRVGEWIVRWSSPA